MASYHMLARGICLLFLYATVLSLAAPVEKEEEEEESETNRFYDGLEHAKTEEITASLTTPTTPPAPESDVANVTIEKTLTNGDQQSSPKMNPTSTAVTSSNNTMSTSQNVTMAATSPNVNSGESSLTATTTSSTATLTKANETEGTAPDEDKSTGENEKGSVIIQKKDGEYRFWWSDSTWLSVVIPVSVGLGSALFLICWICCFRWMCCRRCGRGRSGPFKKKPRRSPTGPARKALRDDFRQLRQKDRMKLLAESSDEEF